MTHMHQPHQAKDTWVMQSMTAVHRSWALADMWSLQGKEPSSFECSISVCVRHKFKQRTSFSNRQRFQHALLYTRAACCADAPVKCNIDHKLCVQVVKAKADLLLGMLEDVDGVPCGAKDHTKPGPRGTSTELVHRSATALYALPV